VRCVFRTNDFADRLCSWTALTWGVVFGSTVVMMAWIVIFSFFFSVDFIDEVTVLFGELTFWTTVVVASFIALGAPHSFACNSLS
jgi:hypothetical protein